MRMSTTRGTAVAAVAACGLLLAGCASSSKPGPGANPAATSTPAAAPTSAASPAASGTVASFCSSVQTLVGQLAGHAPSGAEAQKIYDSISGSAPAALQGDIGQIFAAYKKDGAMATSDPSFVKAETDLVGYVTTHCPGGLGALSVPTALPAG